jgi:hypothetical protein
MVSAALKRKSGCSLLSWTSDNALVLPSSSPKPKSKHSALPVLIFLFFVCWGLMSILIVEQGRTIESQRTLIRSLFQDSSQLSHLKGQILQKQHAEAQAQAEAKAHSQSQSPSTQDKMRDQAKNGSNSHKLQKPVPQKPPTDTATSEDERRNVLTI